MNMRESVEFAPYINAAASGHTVQFECPNGEWRDMAPEDSFVSGGVYRIKPLPVLKPYSRREDIVALIGRTLRVKNSQIYRQVGSVTFINGTWHICLHNDGAKYTPEMLLRKFIHEDDSPCGVYVEEVPPSPKKAGTQSEGIDEDEDIDEDEENEEE